MMLVVEVRYFICQSIVRKVSKGYLRVVTLRQWLVSVYEDTVRCPAHVLDMLVVTARGFGGAVAKPVRSAELLWRAVTTTYHALTT